MRDVLKGGGGWRNTSVTRPGLTPSLAAVGFGVGTRVVFLCQQDSMTGTASR